MEFPNIVETKSKGEKMYLISAYFDENTTRQLQRFIDAVAQNTGNTYMIDNNVPPHLTISSFETRNPQNLCDDFVKLSELESHDINIFSVGEFLPYVIYVTPVLDVTINRCYKPYSWFPHITLGKKLEKEQMIAAVRAMQTHFTPLKGKIVRLGLAQTNPHRDICTVDLK